MITMLLGGLWHGANWTFVLWGAIHGGALAVERYVRSLLGLSKDTTASATTFPRLWLNRIVIFHLVCAAWIFFRAQSFFAAIEMFQGLRSWHWESQYLAAFEFLALFTIPLFIVDLAIERSGNEYVFQQRSPAFRMGWAMATLAVLTLFTANQASAFIYFQF
jgi:D-alanyl-lipoteichoic acid acyltransferase DltB (MBOAT superfamily)